MSPKEMKNIKASTSRRQVKSSKPISSVEESLRQGCIDAVVVVICIVTREQTCQETQSAIFRLRIKSFKISPLHTPLHNDEEETKSESTPEVAAQDPQSEERSQDLSD